MKRKKHLVSAFIFTGFLIMAIACVPSVRNLTVEKGRVAPDFPGYTGTLLIKSGSKPWNRHVEKYLSSVYKGPAQIVEVDDLTADPYTDLTKYRFLLDHSVHQNYDAMGSSTSRGGNVVLVDRQTGKRYPTISSSRYFKILKNYLAALEGYRTK